MVNPLYIKTPLQQRWIDKLETFKEAFQQQSEASDKNAKLPIDNIRALVECGYTTLPLPKDAGGKGIGVRDLVQFQELIASYDSATALSIGWHLGVVGEIFEANQWTAKQLKQFAEAVMNGALVNRAVSETMTGSPTRGGRPGTTAVKQGNTWVINGQKQYTSMSPVLTHYLVSAWIDEKEEIGFFLVPAETTGVSIEETWNMVGMRGTESHDLRLDHVVLPKDSLVELNRRNERNGWSLHIPACYLGISQAARDYAIEFAKTHQPNSLSHPISELPNVQAIIGNIDLQLTTARQLLYSVSEAYDDPTRKPYLTNELNVAKYVVTNAAIDIVDNAMRIVGAKSLELSNPLQRYYRDVRAGLHNPPMDDMTIQKLAKTALFND